MTMPSSRFFAARALFRAAPPALWLLTAFGLFVSGCGGDSPTTAAATTPRAATPAPPPAPLRVPTGLRAAETGQTSITWRWDSVPGATRYNFEMEGPGLRVLQFVAAPDTEYRASLAIRPGQTYRARVRAETGTGRNSGWSSWVSARTEEEAAPAVPTGLRVSDTESDSIRWTWRYISGLTYEFELSGPGVSRVYEWGDFPGTDWFRATGLTPGTTYRGRVRAVEGGRRSEWTSWVSGRTEDAAPRVPTGLRVSDTESDSIRWEWRRISGLTYEFELSGPGVSRVYEWGDFPGFDWFRATGLRPGTTYRGRVRAVDGGRRSGWSSWVSGRTQRGASAAPAVPTDFRVHERESTSITWRWDLIRGATGYDLEVGISGVGSEVFDYDQPYEAGRGLAVTIRGMDPGTTYRARVRAKNSHGRSDWTSWVSGRTRESSTAPGVPADFRVHERESTSIVWRWNLVPGATGYDLEVGIRGGGSQVFDIDRTYEPGTAYGQRVTGMDPGTTYRARVRAKNRHGRSDWTSWVSATTRSSSSAPAPSGAPPPGTKMNLVLEGQEDVGEGPSPRMDLIRLRPGPARLIVRR